MVALVGAAEDGVEGFEGAFSGAEGGGDGGGGAGAVAEGGTVSKRSAWATCCWRRFMVLVGLGLRRGRRWGDDWGGAVCTDVECEGYRFTDLLNYLAMEDADRALEFVVLNRLKALHVGVAAFAQKWSRRQFHLVSGTSVSRRDRGANRQCPWSVSIFPGNNHHHADLASHAQIDSVNLPGFSLHIGSRWHPASFGLEAVGRYCQEFPQ